MFGTEVNGGNVTQNNSADTTATATNSNATSQTIDLAQLAKLFGWGGGDVDQSQDATNDTCTDQDASAHASR